MVIIDTGFFYALADTDDNDHLRAIHALSHLNEEGITTWPVLTETCHLLLARLGYDALERFMSSIDDHHIFNIKDEQIVKIRNMMSSYQNLPMDLADASLVILAEHLNDGRILTTDRRDFNAYRWKSRHPFTNLLDQSP